LLIFINFFNFLIFYFIFFFLIFFGEFRSTVRLHTASKQRAGPTVRTDVNLSGTVVILVNSSRCIYIIYLTFYFLFFGHSRRTYPMKNCWNCRNVRNPPHFGTLSGQFYIFRTLFRHTRTFSITYSGHLFFIGAWMPVPPSQAMRIKDARYSAWRRNCMVW
jgi:hypothetical protein